MNQQHPNQEVLNSPPIKVKKPWVTPEVSESPMNDLTNAGTTITAQAADGVWYS